MNNDIVFYYLHKTKRNSSIYALRCASDGQAKAQYRVSNEHLNDVYTELKPHLFDPYPDVCTVVTLESRSNEFPSHYAFVTLHQMLHPLMVSGRLNRLSVVQISMYLKVELPARGQSDMTTWIANCYFAYIKAFKLNYTLAKISTDVFDEITSWTTRFLGGA